MRRYVYESATPNPTSGHVVDEKHADMYTFTPQTHRTTVTSTYMYLLDLSLWLHAALPYPYLCGNARGIGMGIGGVNK